MDSNSLFELKNKLAALPILEERMKNLLGKIYRAEEDVKSLLRKFEAESLDVDQIQKDSFANTILKLIGKYEGKVNKETQEMLSAKMDYDKAVERVRDLNTERMELGRKISDLNKEKQVFDTEFKKREEWIKSNTTDQMYIIYMGFQTDQDNLSKQIIEIEEAITAAKRVLSTADIAMDHLKSAESWATFDVWSRGGILSHMAKYEHIDDAQNAFYRLTSQVKDFEKELKDINISETYSSIGIDSTTRAVDFWFDNIFTDMRVRDKIRGDMETIRSLYSSVSRAVNQLETNWSEINKRLKEIENKKNDLIMSV